LYLLDTRLRGHDALLTYRRLDTRLRGHDGARACIAPVLGFFGLEAVSKAV